MICQLCKNDTKEIRNSHIFPEFLYSDTYDDKGRAMGVNGEGSRNWKYVQKGIREKLLCGDCEQFLGKHYERPFREYWYGKSKIPKYFTRKYLRIDDVDYESFKLFHLSNLYRASVSTHPMYSDVKLGPHEEIIRKMILSRDAGPVNQYPIFGYVVMNGKSKVTKGLITKPYRGRFDGHTVYIVMFGGCMWHYLISKHTSSEFSRIAVQKNGTATLTAEYMSEIEFLKQISEVLVDGAL